MTRGSLSALLRLEAKKWFSDRIYILFLVLPIVIVLFFALAWPVAEALAWSRLGFNLVPYRGWLGVVVLYLAPQLLGMALGFRLLEEKDQGTLGYFPVMPAGLLGYLIGLLTLMGVVSICYHLLLPLALPAHFAGWDYGMHVGVGLLTALEGAIFALFLSMLARDKVEGMTMGKALSLLTALPMLVLVVPEWFTQASPAWLLGLTPWIWPVALLTIDVHSTLLLYVAALIVHLLWLVLLFRTELRAIKHGRR